MADIQLNFINNSNDLNNSQVVIFQKNEAVNFDENAVAWKVIDMIGRGDNHLFTFPLQSDVAASDSWGNFTPIQSAADGQQFSVLQDARGTELEVTGTTSNNQIHVTNALTMGAISANIYKDGKLLATKTGVAPGEKAVFEFKPTLWIGVVSQIEQGDVMNSAIIQNVNTQLSLLGIQKANIVLTGGGPGKSSTPFNFTLENIVYA